MEATISRHTAKRRRTHFSSTVFLRSGLSSPIVGGQLEANYNPGRTVQSTGKQSAIPPSADSSITQLSRSGTASSTASPSHVLKPAEREPPLEPSPAPNSPGAVVGRRRRELHRGVWWKRKNEPKDEGTGDLKRGREQEEGMAAGQGTIGDEAPMEVRGKEKVLRDSGYFEGMAMSREDKIKRFQKGRSRHPVILDPGLFFSNGWESVDESSGKQGSLGNALLVKETTMASKRRGSRVSGEGSSRKRPRDHHLTVSEDCSDERQVLKRRLLALKGRTGGCK